MGLVIIVWRQASPKVKQPFEVAQAGGVAFLGGSSFFSRRITDSFALVQVPGYSDVGIYATTNCQHALMQG